MNLPFDPNRLDRTMQFPAETADGQPYDVFLWTEGALSPDGAWHRVTALAPLDYIGLEPWVFTICRREADETTPRLSYMGGDFLDVTIPAGGFRCERCFGEVR